ncbi:MAG: alginate O-acetyltransferase AlgX-related protein [Marinobacter sp.]
MLRTLISSLMLIWLVLPAQASAQCDGLDCLLCEGLADDIEYAEGSMKSLKRIAPGKDHWLFRSDVDLSNEFGIPSEFLADYRRLIQKFNEYGTEVVFIVQPTRGLMHRDKIREDKRYGFNYQSAYTNLQVLLSQLEDGGAHVPNILPLVESPPEQEYFFRRDHHWTPSGARETAMVAARKIKTLPAYHAIANKEFVTEKASVISKDGTMNRGLREICGNNYGFQYVQGYQTVPAADGADALFGDTEEVEILLVGTSNSAARDDEYKNYNFEGFLKDELQRDILNYALPGSGQDGSMLQYLLSEDYSPEAPPKLVIWELPASYRLDDQKIYRQLIPAIEGGCGFSDNVQGHNKITVPKMKEGQRLEVYSNAGADQKNLSNFGGYLDIKFSDLAIKDFYVITYFDNGQRDKVWFRRAGIVDGGQYYLELPRDTAFRNANLLSVFIEPTDPIKKESTLEVSVCQ